MLKQMKLGFSYEGEMREIWINVVYSDRKTLGLEVGRDGHVTLRSPRKMADKTLQTFAQQKEGWIIEKYLMMEGKRKKEGKQELPDYVKHPDLEKRYRELARVKLKERAEYFSRKMGVSYERISIRAAKTRWGSCSGKGNLNFHWKLILMPPQVLDYVVVHELAHRKEMNHSPAFWAEVERILPDYREQRKWLKVNGQMV